MAILLFTVIIKIVLMPLSLWCQWNSIVMVKIMPELNRIKVKYFGDAETIGEKQTLLNKKHHYHPLLSLIPLAAQILVLFGLVEVIQASPTTALREPSSWAWCRLKTEGFLGSCRFWPVCPRW